MTELRGVRIGNNNKNIPDKTTLEIKNSFGSLDVKLKFPGQSHFTEFKGLKIQDGILNIPIKLAFLSYSSKTSREKQFVQNLSNDLWRWHYVLVGQTKSSFW